MTFNEVSSLVKVQQARTWKLEDVERAEPRTGVDSMDCRGLVWMDIRKVWEDDGRLMSGCGANRTEKVLALEIVNGGCACHV